VRIPVVPAALALAAGLLSACANEPDRSVEVTRYNAGRGVPLYVSTDAAKLKGAPKDFQKFMSWQVRSAIESDDGTCVESPVYSVKAVASTGHASGQFSQCGVEDVIWARRSSHWVEVWSGKGEPPCAALRKYQVPHGIAGQSCRDPDGSHVYTG
jgi:hypothetical protein